MISVHGRHEIEMGDREVLRFLQEERTVICATNGVRGWPHLMPLWYVLRDGNVWAWTYAKSQKSRNLERDPRATLQVEAGAVYAELRGVMIEAEAVFRREPALVMEVGRALSERYGGSLEHAASQAAKRVAIEFRTVRVASWDHRKLR